MPIRALPFLKWLCVTAGRSRHHCQNERTALRKADTPELGVTDSVWQKLSQGDGSPNTSSLAVAVSIM
jgi:hypothetical protein